MRTSRATAKRITAAIAGYTARLGVSKDKAYALYKQHGTCLQGMLNEGIMAPEGVEEYLLAAHDIEYGDIAEDPPLRAMIERCATKVG